MSSIPKIVICSHDDMTSNILFSKVALNPKFEISGIFTGTSFNEKSNSKFDYTKKLFRKVSRLWVLHQITLNGVYLIYKFFPKFLKKRYGGRLKSLFYISSKKNIPYKQIDSFNDKEFLEELRRLKPDYILIRIGEVLSEEFLKIPKLKTLCVHSSLLPSGRGIAGEFHAIRTGNPLGTTVFEVSLELDEGVNLALSSLDIASKSLPNIIIANNVLGSELINNYLENPDLEIWENSLNISKTLKTSYFSFPTPSETREFKTKNIKLFGLSFVFELFKFAK